jgi:hypothetical protein
MSFRKVRFRLAVYHRSVQTNQSPTHWYSTVSCLISKGARQVPIGDISLSLGQGASATTSLADRQRDARRHRLLVPSTRPCRRTYNCQLGWPMTPGSSSLAGDATTPRDAAVRLHPCRHAWHILLSLALPFRSINWAVGVAGRAPRATNCLCPSISVVPGWVLSVARAEPSRAANYLQAVAHPLWLLRLLLLLDHVPCAVASARD